MTNQNYTFYCELCEKTFKHGNAFSQDLHIRQLHSSKVIADAVKQYTRVVFEDMQ